MRVGQAAPVARADAQRGDLDLLEAALELFEIQFQRLLRGGSADRQPPRGGIDLRDVGRVKASLK
jgi:hypothetical protein